MTEDKLNSPELSPPDAPNASRLRHSLDPAVHSPGGADGAGAGLDEPFGGLTRVFERAAIGMALVDFDCRFLSVNAALCSLLGRSRDEVLSTTWTALTHPDDISVGKEHARRMARGEEETFQLEKRYVRPDGSVVWAMLSVSLMPGTSLHRECMFTQVVDMTRHRQVEEARNRLATIADLSEDGIIGTTVEGAITAWNAGAAGIYGYRTEEVVGSDLLMLVPDDRQDELRSDLERLRRFRRVVVTDTLCKPKHGPPIDVSTKLTALLDGTGRLTGISVIARDMTEQRWLASTLDTTLMALEQALRRARDSEARSRRFLADAAHQLRTPVAGVQACAETLLRGVSKEDADRILTHLLHETSRASRLMGSLLRIARLDQGEQVMPKPCNLAALCEDEAGRVRARAPGLLVTCRVGVMAQSQPRLDSHAVREILANLLDNARRYALQTIEIEIDGCDGVVRIDVMDDGPGMPRDMADRAFERFVGLDDRSGSGLGLPIARDLARAHGGDLTYEGRRFVVRLSECPPPLGQADQEEPDAAENTAPIRPTTYP